MPANEIQEITKSEHEDDGHALDTASKQLMGGMVDEPGSLEEPIDQEIISATNQWHSSMSPTNANNVPKGFPGMGGKGVGAGPAKKAKKGKKGVRKVTSGAGSASHNLINVNTAGTLKNNFLK